MESTKPTQIYQEREDFFQEKCEFWKKKSHSLSILRLLVFLGLFFCFLCGFQYWRSPDWSWVLAGLFLSFVFITLVNRHQEVSKQKDECEVLADINRDTLARWHRNWGELAPAELPAELSAPGYGKDLDVFGKASLFQLLGTCHTDSGRKCLAQWLSQPASWEEVKQRQEAVQELSSKLEMRQSIEQKSRVIAKSKANISPFVKWTFEKPWLLEKLGLLWLARILAFLTCLLVVLELTGVVAGHLWGLFFFINFVISITVGSTIHRIFGKVSLQAKEVRQYHDMFAILAKEKWTSSYLQNIQEQSSACGQPTYQHLRKLEVMMQLADLRYSQMLYYPVQSLTMWDFHVLYRLEKWQASIVGKAELWFEALGKWEALCALAALSHAHPGWTFPTIEEKKDTIEAKALGHPLLSDGKRVANDLTLGPPGSFLLITGSNMSGKSTLLRSLGSAVILAQAGAPVCAESLSLPPLQLATVMRVEDSLEEGVSYFMAELKRLKGVIDRARELSPEQPIKLLYLLDEILQGTNTAERQVAVRKVVHFLVRQPALGAISTHDLELAQVEELASVNNSIHFRENIILTEEGGHMSFDYKIRPGIATTVNALKLLEIVGLNFETPEKK